MLFHWTWVVNNWDYTTFVSLKFKGYSRTIVSLIYVFNISANKLGSHNFSFSFLSSVALMWKEINFGDEQSRARDQEFLNNVWFVFKDILCIWFLSSQHFHSYTDRDFLKSYKTVIYDVFFKMWSTYILHISLTLIPMCVAGGFYCNSLNTKGKKLKVNVKWMYIL